jgi:hypothetical protein
MTKTKLISVGLKHLYDKFGQNKSTCFYNYMLPLQSFGYFSNEVAIYSQQYADGYFCPT